MADKKILATEGREEIAGKRYVEIRNIISQNSDLKFKDIIGEIAGISAGTYYNYTSENSPKYGKISLYTVKQLSKFFDLPLSIFDCSSEFTDSDKNKIKKIISDKYTLSSQVSKTDSLFTPEVLNNLDYAAKMLDCPQSDILTKSLNEFFLFPFCNITHLTNYFYLLNKSSLALKEANYTNKDSKQQILGCYLSFLYCISFENVIMEYIRDGENIIDFQYPYPNFTYINQLDYYYHESSIYSACFLELVLQKYCHFEFEFEDDTPDLSVDEMKVLTNSLLFNSSTPVKNLEWYSKIFHITTDEILPTRFSLEDFLSSTIFNQYSSICKKTLLLLFEKMSNASINFYIELRFNDVLSIYAQENIGDRLAIITVCNNFIILTIIYENYKRYFGSSPFDVELLDYFVELLVRHYNNPPNHKGMKYDWNTNTYIDEEVEN